MENEQEKHDRGDRPQTHSSRHHSPSPPPPPRQLQDIQMRPISRSPPPTTTTNKQHNNNNGKGKSVSRSPPPPRSVSRSPTRRSRSRSPRRSPPRRSDRGEIRGRIRSRSPRSGSRSRTPTSVSPGRSGSRSRSPRRGGGDRGRSSSKSPGRYRQPTPCDVLGVFGLNPNTTRRDLEDEFSRFSGFDRVDLIIDRQTMCSKCFAFVYFTNVEAAIKAKEELVGITLQGRSLRVDFSFTKKAHSPTPGRYLGKSTRPYRSEKTPYRSTYPRYPSSSSSYDYYGGSRGRGSPPRERRDYYDDRDSRYDRDRSSFDRYDRYSSYDRGFERPSSSYDRPSFGDYGRRPYRLVPQPHHTSYALRVVLFIKVAALEKEQQPMSTIPSLC